MGLKVHKLKSLINKARREKLSKIIKEIKQKENIVFLSSPHSLALAVLLYMKDREATRLLVGELCENYKRCMVKALKNIIMKASEEPENIKYTMKKPTSEVLYGYLIDTLSYLRDHIAYMLWFERAVLYLKLRPYPHEIKSYGRKGRTAIYHYLDAIENILSSFNLSISSCNLSDADFFFLNGITRPPPLY